MKNVDADLLFTASDARLKAYKCFHLKMPMKPERLLTCSEEMLFFMIQVMLQMTYMMMHKLQGLGLG